MCLAISLMARAPVPSTPVSACASGRLGCDYGGQREQTGSQRSNGVRPQEHVASLGHHHRIDHQVPDAMLLDLVGHRADDAGVGEHAGLDRVGADVVHDGVDLGGDQGRRRFEDPCHAGGILGSDGGDHRSAVDSQRGKGLEIGLKAGSGPGIRACNGKRFVELH